MTACFEASHTLKIPVLLRNNYYVNSTVPVPSYVRVKGVEKDETRPNIIAGPNCSLVFNVTSIVNTFEGFNIKNYESTYRNFNGMLLTGNFANDVDSTIRRVDFGYMDTCLEIRGRNVDVIECGFGHARVGIYWNLPDTQMRGIKVDACRFHGMGEEAAIPWFTNSYSIVVEQNYWSNVTITNCIHDQGGTFFKGYCTQGLFEGNYLECYEATPIIIDGPASGQIGNTGTLMFVGNYISGKRGAVTSSYTAVYPDHLLEITDFTRCSFVGNLFRMCGAQAVMLDNAKQINFQANTFIAAGQYGNAVAIDMRNGCVAEFYNNVAYTSGITMFNGTASDSFYYGNNIAFGIPSSSSVVQYDTKREYLLGSCASNSVLGFTLPDQFMVRTGDGRTCFNCCKVGSYYSNGIALSEDNSSVNILKFEVSDDDVTPVLNSFSLSDWSRTGSVATLYFFKVVN